MRGRWVVRKTSPSRHRKPSCTLRYRIEAMTAPFARPHPSPNCSVVFRSRPLRYLTAAFNAAPERRWGRARRYHGRDEGVMVEMRDRWARRGNDGRGEGVMVEMRE